MHFYKTMSTISLALPPGNVFSAVELVSSAHHLSNSALCSHYGLLKKDPIKKKKKSTACLWSFGI